MKLSNLLVVAAVIGAVFGVAFVVASGPLLAIYGISLDKAGTLVAQLFGAALISLSVLNWFARNVTDPEARRAVVLGNLAGTVVGFVVILLGQLAGVANALVYPWNVSGTPAISLPIGARRPIPTSLQLVGPWNSEELLVATAAAVSVTAASPAGR